MCCHFSLCPEAGRLVRGSLRAQTLLRAAESATVDSPIGGVKAHQGLTTSPRCPTFPLGSHEVTSGCVTWEWGGVQEMGTESNYFLSRSVDEWGSDQLPGELVAALCLVWSPRPGTGKTLERSQ